MRRLYRSRYDKKIAGICGGIGNYFSIDPVFIRLLVIFLWIITGLIPLILIYLVASFIIPQEPINSPAIEFKRLYRARNDRIIAGICGGVAKLFKIDSTVLRLIIFVVTCLTGFLPMFVAYLVGWAIIPEKNL